MSDIRVVFNHSIASILSEAKRQSGFRAKFIQVEGRPISEFILSSDEDDLMKTELENAINQLFSEMSGVARNLVSPAFIDIDKTVNEYVDQTTFVMDEIWSKDDILYKCLGNTSSYPDSLLPEWLVIDDKDRVYFIMALNEYWDINLGSALDKAIFNYLMSFILEVWYKLLGADKERVEWFTKREDYLMAAKKATYVRTKAIVRENPPI